MLVNFDDQKHCFDKEKGMLTCAHVDTRVTVYI